MELDSIIEREEIQRREKREERREKREERREKRKSRKIIGEPMHLVESYLLFY